MKNSAIGILFVIISLQMVNPGMQANAQASQSLGRYCSMVWPSGGWGFAFFNTMKTDKARLPCDYLRANSDSGGTVARAGLYSKTGMNNVVARCGPSANYVWQFQGRGDRPLKAAHKAASESKQGQCFFIASPKEWPLYTALFPDATATTHGRAFDFARWPYDTVDVPVSSAARGGPVRRGARSTVSATIVNWKGTDKSSLPSGFDNHDAMDIGAPVGTPLYAAARGRVLRAHSREVSCSQAIAGSLQTEIYVDHRISGQDGILKPGALRMKLTEYDERFITYYAHMDNIQVKDGEWIEVGEQIGTVGNQGCSGGPHLHFNTFKVTNTSGYYRYPIKIPTVSDFKSDPTLPSTNMDAVAISDRGWLAAYAFDPWSWRAYQSVNGDGKRLGALSVNLWKKGEAPAPDVWE